MEFPEKALFAEIGAELTARAGYLTACGHQAVAHVDWDRNQYQIAEEDTELPFLRPAVFIGFGKMSVTPEGLRRRVTIPLIVTVVQDKYVDAALGSSSQTEYLKLLEYKYKISDVLENMQGSCFSKMYLIAVGPDRANRNLHIETLEYEVHTTLKRTFIP
jgi:hypothetical protein